MEKERRNPVLTDGDIERLIEKLTPSIVEHLTQPNNIDKFAQNFEQRWRDYFYRGLGRGIAGGSQRGLIYGLMVLAGYGMSKYKFFN